MTRLLKKLSWDWCQGIKDYAHYLKYQSQSKGFRNLSIIAIALFVFTQAFIPGSAGALNPKFNFMPGDYELLRGANSTTGEQHWHDPVSGKLGDVISWNVYYHNGVEQTVAHNTTIQVVLPQNSSNQLVLQGKLWADNADMVTDTGTVNLDSQAKIRYIPGSTLWYPNRSTTPQSLPDGVTEGGVNIGDVIGCWPYAGFVVFQTEIITAEASLHLDKKVANSTEDPGTQDWYKENTANPGDFLAYQLYIKNTGNDTANNLRIKDILPEHTSYVSGSTYLYTNQTGPDGQQLPDGITSENGISLNNLEPGDVNSGYIVFQVQIANLTTSGIYTLTNTTLLWAANASQVQSTATTIVNIGAAEIQKSKTALNQTQGIDATATTANPGDIINYNLSTKNNGDGTASGFVVSDNISDILEYANLINANNGNLANGVISYPAINIESGQTINKTFSVQIKNPIPVNPQNGKSYDFQMENVYGNTIIVPVFKPQVGYYFNKSVRNISRNQTHYHKLVEATYGEQLEYKIDVANTGNVDITNVRIWDTLPQYQTLIAGSVKFYGPDGGSLQLSDTITTTGIGLDNFPSGLSGYIVFRVQVASCPPAGIHNLTNTAFATTHQTGQISDTASVRLIITPPIDPPVR